MDEITYENGAISLAEIKKAADRLNGQAKVTPVLTCSTLNSLADLDLYFKAEIFQKTGSFKFRGAFNSVSSLSESAALAGVVTHSSGNHAAAVALAAKLRSIPSNIIVPSTTPKIKQEAVKTYGGQLIICEPTIDARETTCNQVQKQTGATFIPPYNHPWVICGQGTIGLEFLEQKGPLDAIIVPISGGGMISGIAVAAKSIYPSIKIFAAEPCGTNNAADVAASKAAGELVVCAKPETICDGLQARLGSITWPIVRDLVDDVIVITETEVVNAMQLCYERMKVVVEPSGAAGLAAALKFRQRPEFDSIQKVGVILCGGNVDLDGQIPGFWSKWLEK